MEPDEAAGQLFIRRARMLLKAKTIRLFSSSAASHRQWLVSAVKASLLASRSQFLPRLRNLPAMVEVLDRLLQTDRNQ